MATPEALLFRLQGIDDPRIKIVPRPSLGAGTGTFAEQGARTRACRPCLSENRRTGERGLSFEAAVQLAHFHARETSKALESVGAGALRFAIVAGTGGANRMVDRLDGRPRS